MPETTEPDELAQPPEAAPPAAQPGWYPAAGGGQRYWDGGRWIDIPLPGANTPALAPPRRSVTRPIVVLIAVAALVVGIVAGGLGTLFVVTRPAPTEFTARVNVVLTTTDPTGACNGPEGYADVGPDTPVRITAAGHTVATGILGAGSSSRGGSQCDYTFAVAHIPVGYQFYGVAVGGHGPIQVPAVQLRATIARVMLGSG